MQSHHFTNYYQEGELNFLLAKSIAQSFKVLICTCWCAVVACSITASGVYGSF